MSNSRSNSIENQATYTAGPSNDASFGVAPNNGALRYAMSRSLAKTQQQDEDNMPSSTVRAYGRKQEEFSAWARRTFTDEPELMRDIVSGVKLNYFLHEQVIFCLNVSFNNKTSLY